MMIVDVVVIYINRCHGFLGPDVSTLQIRNAVVILILAACRNEWIYIAQMKESSFIIYNTEMDLFCIYKAIVLSVFKANISVLEDLMKVKFL